MTLYPDPDLVAQYDISTCLKTGVLPLYKTASTLVVASPDLTQTQSTLFSESHDIQHVSESDFYDAIAAFLKIDKETFIDDLVDKARQQSASDIHFFRKEASCSIQFRIHGVMQPYLSVPLPSHNWIFAQLKLRSDCDISITTKPQDGRFSSRDTQVRVATMPTVYGEDIVCRLLTQTGTQTLAECGFYGHRFTMLQTMIREESGLILVTGPTGSGKTTTVYALLRELQALRSGTLVTLEDPVEAILDGVRQSPINPESGFSFSSGLKATLRQDPDIIMVGEIRDKETAVTALNAAYTGHLVISTLHTDDVASTLLRLQSFELDPFLVSYSLKGIVSQKLVLNTNGTRALSSEMLRLDKQGVTSYKDMSELITKGQYIGFGEDK